MRSAIVGSPGLRSMYSISSPCRPTTLIGALRTCLPLLISGTGRAAFTKLFIGTASQTSARGSTKERHSNRASHERIALSGADGVVLAVQEIAHPGAEHRPVHAGPVTVARARLDMARWAGHLLDLFGSVAIIMTSVTITARGRDQP